MNGGLLESIGLGFNPGNTGNHDPTSHHDPRKVRAVRERGATGYVRKTVSVSEPGLLFLQLKTFKMGRGT